MLQVIEMNSPEQSAPRPPAQWNREKLPYVKRVIAVASGKGGVGKSTVAVSLAFALKAQGLSVGILDADIYGPSIPRMLGLDIRLQPEIKDGKMLPPVSHGIKAMSMALITGSQAAILRGPMVTKSLQQLLRSTAWASESQPMDILLVDMPPGTGDIHLSMAQQVPLDGAIIITTPQQVAVIDADKAAQMFTKLSVPIFGVIENMSYFTDPSGAKHHLFGEGGGKELAGKYAAPFLGSLPLDPMLGICADKGEAYSGIATAEFSTIAGKIATSWREL
jgi:ATP-binding protein involved in chromosome partitioning